MAKPIYTVTTLFFKDGNIVRQRTPGWFYSKKKAQKCIEQNWGDIYEHAYYNYALIEEVHEGLYNIGSKKLHESCETWFAVCPREVPGENYLEYDVIETVKPVEYKGVVNFSMG